MFELRGSNCGPGALSAVSGEDLEKVLDVLGKEFDRRRATTEIMMMRAMDHMQLDWRQIEPAFPDYGLARIQWDGPWMALEDRFAPLRHSHWIGSAMHEGDRMIFDFNAISFGGWISLREWDEHLRPWLLSTAEPEATGAWWVSDAYEVAPLPGLSRTRTFEPISDP